MRLLSIQELAICSALAASAAAVFGGYFPVTAVIATAYLTFVVAAITVSDARRFIIPDVLSLPAIPAGILASWLISVGDGWHAAMTSLLGALLGGASLYAIKAGYAWIKDVDGLGLGDVKLFAAGGAWLGPTNLAVTLLLASLAAIVSLFLSVAITGRRDVTRMTAIPFGAFIAPAIWLIWMFEQIWPNQLVGLPGL